MTTEPVGLSIHQVCAVSGASYRQVDYWDRTHFVVPSIAEARSSGSRRRYSIDDAVICRLAVVMGTRRNRLPRGMAIGSAVREALGKAGAFVVIPADGGPIVTCDPAAALAGSDTIVTVVNLSAIYDHVVAALAVARSASEPTPLPVPGAERGAAGVGRLGEVAPDSGCTTTSTTTNSDLGVEPEVASIA